MSDTKYPVLITVKHVPCAATRKNNKASEKDMEDDDEDEETDNEYDTSILQVWDMKGGELLKKMKPNEIKPHMILSLAKTNDNKIVTVGNDNKVNLYF